MRVVRVVAAELGGEDLPDAQEQARDDRPDDEPRHAERGDPAERREQDDVVRHARVAADEDRPQRVVDEPDKARTDADEDQAFRDVARHEQEQRGRRPHDGCADGRHERHERHEDAPQNWRAEAERGERDRPDRPLDERDEERPLDGRPCYGGKAREDEPLARVAERERAHERRHERVAVAEKEEQRVERHDEQQHERQRALPEREQPRCELPADVERRRLGRAADLVEVDPDPGGPAREPRQHRLDLPYPLVHVQLARGDALVQADRLARHRDADADERHDDEQEDREQRRERRRRVTPSEGPEVAPVERREQDREDDRPEDGQQKALDRPQQRERHEGDEQEEGAVFEGVDAHRESQAEGSAISARARCRRAVQTQGALV